MTDTTESGLTRSQREQWRDDVERERVGGHVYGDAKRILVLLDALDDMQRQRDALNRSDSEWRREALAARALPPGTPTASSGSGAS